MTILYFEKHITRKSFLLLTLFMMVRLCGLAQLKADFTSSATSGCTPLFVQFEDKSTGNPDEWIWDLGDGVPITQQNPGIIYINPGSYTIKLTVKNANGKDSITKVSYINVYAKPKVDFSANPTSGCFPLLVNFSDKTIAGSGSIKSWFWDFGDGTHDSVQNPTHLYDLTDTFTVTLKVVNSFGCAQTINKPSFVSVADTVQSDFNFSVDNVCALPSNVSFTNLSNSAVPLSYQWTFGDGVSSAISSPSHTYDKAGTYNVRLIASNSDGCSDTTIKPVFIGTPKADFSYPVSACVGQQVTFKDSSNPAPAGGLWDFGDGTFGNGLSVTHIYAKAGIYVVSYKATYGGCSGTIKKNIEVVDAPVVAFSSSSLLGKCVAPLTVQFKNTSTSGGSWLWDFGDGTTSTDANPVHTYTADGNYTVTLTAYSAKGTCSNSLSVPGFVKIGQPVINGIQNLPFKGCAPSSVPFVANIYSPEQIASYTWHFGDGASSSAATPVHDYSVPGVYDVSLLIKTTSGCTDSFAMNDAIFINTKPVVNFTANPIDACASSDVQFFDQTPGTNDLWIWNFGDGTTSNDQNPLHHYYDTGYFSVTLYVYNNGCSDSALFTNYIHVRPPVAKFQPVVNCGQRFQRTFNDQSVGALSWNWDFGDGSTDTVSSPVHLYSDTGRYDVRLIVSNETCSDTLTLPVSIIKESPGFTLEAVNSNYCEHDSIRLAANNYTLTNISGFKWSFGDGGQTSYNSKDTVIYYKYDSSGTYTPMLYVRDKNNCIDSVMLSQTTVRIYGPSASFSNLDGICRGKDFIFQDQSKDDGLHPIQNWFWDYGDGSSENLASGPFKHFYADTGTYDVKLVVSDNNGCSDTAFKPGGVIIAAPVADFALFDSVKCTQNSIALVNNSVGIDLAYAWDFGDGNTSSSPNPSYTYAKEGIYSIGLRIEDRFGCSDSLFKQDIITISNPIASFTISDSIATCPPLEVDTKNYSKNYQNVLWDFGDGNTSTLKEPSRLYLIPGNYNLQLVVHGFGSCYDTATKLITIKGPKGSLSYTPDQACYPAKVSFSAVTQNTVSFIWDFGDGSTQFGASNTTTYDYSTPGAYVPKLILKDNSGCQVAIVNTDTIKISGVHPKIIPLVSIGCDSSLVVFTDSSSFSFFDPVKSRVVDFGDGFSSTDANPLHYYRKTGTYNAVVNIETELGCTGTYTTPVKVDVKQAPSIVSVVPDSACLNTSLNFYANETTNIPYTLQWHWDFGNNTGSTDQNTVYSYSVPGDYPVTLTLEASNGCSDHEQHDLVILPDPNTDAGQNAAICLSNAVTLQPTGAVKYVWDPSESLSCSKCANPIARPVANTTYYVNGSDDFGCVRRDSLSVQVIQPVRVDLNVKSDTVCAGSSVLLMASGADKYQWLPANGLSDPNIANPVATPSGTTVYSVIGSDSKSCFNDTATVTVLVAPIPTFDISDSLVTAGAGSTYTIKAQSSPDVVSWIWQPAYNLSCSNCAQPTTILKTNVTYTAQAINTFGCVATDNIRFEVTCNNSNVFIPNTFSPNNDSRNDYFYPQGRGLFTIKSMKIFNRWGVMVYSKANFTANLASAGWDGKYAGTDQPTGVYIYMIDVLCDNGTVLTYKGDVTLIR